jgi:hypothetical protein
MCAGNSFREKHRFCTRTDFREKHGKAKNARKQKRKKRQSFEINKSSSPQELISSEERNKMQESTGAAAELYLGRQ